MGLKAFHMIFIIVSIAIAGYFSYWSFNYYSQNSNSSYLGISIVSLIITIALILYGIKTKKKFSK